MNIIAQANCSICKSSTNAKLYQITKSTYTTKNRNTYLDRGAIVGKYDFEYAFATAYGSLICPKCMKKYILSMEKKLTEHARSYLSKNMEDDVKVFRSHYTIKKDDQIEINSILDSKYFKKTYKIITDPDNIEVKACISEGEYITTIICYKDGDDLLVGTYKEDFKREPRKDTIRLGMYGIRSDDIRKNKTPIPMMIRACYSLYDIDNGVRSRNDLIEGYLDEFKNIFNEEQIKKITYKLISS